MYKYYFFMGVGGSLIWYSITQISNITNCVLLIIGIVLLLYSTTRILK